MMVEVVERETGSEYESIQGRSTRTQTKSEHDCSAFGINLISREYSLAKTDKNTDTFQHDQIFNFHNNT